MANYDNPKYRIDVNHYPDATYITTRIDEGSCAHSLKTIVVPSRMLDELRRKLNEI